MSARTRIVSTVHRPLGRPGGPGPYGLGSTAQHSAYMQNIVRALMRKGRTESQAFRLAWGILRNFARGRNGHGGKVSAQVQAAAAKALAEETALRARAKATPNKSTTLAVEEHTMSSQNQPRYAVVDLATGQTVDAVELARRVTAAAGPVGTGARFKRLKRKLARRGARNAGALAAYIGRRKYGPAGFAALSAAGRAHKRAKK